MAEAADLVNALLAAGAPAGGGKKKKGGARKSRGPLSAEHKAKLQAGRARAQAAKIALLQQIAGAGRNQVASANERVARMSPGKAKRQAVRALYGGSPLKDLFSGQRGTIRQSALSKKSVDPLLAVQLFAQQGGIKSATRCAAAIEAARQASRAGINPQKQRRAGGMTPARARALYAALSARSPAGAAKFQRNYGNLL